MSILKHTREMETLGYIFLFQKEHVDRIYYHAYDATNYVDQGLMDLQKGNKLKKRTRTMVRNKKKSKISITFY